MENRPRLGEDRIPVKNALSPQASCIPYGDPTLLESGYGSAPGTQHSKSDAFGKLEMQENGETQSYLGAGVRCQLTAYEAAWPLGGTMQRRTPGSSLLWVGPSAHELGEAHAQR
jgi:hypothetical protein